MEKLYQLYDCKSETWTPPTVNPARGQALRSFADAVNDGQSILSKHPEDFTLFEIGTFDKQTGQISLYEVRESVANGLDVKLVG
ncbi:MAG: hypothetical protein L6Q57_10020 [Alphaproteobacteria bacterium]|nr:hypothetical protein [Alphaproteobacteria bacterium]